MYSVDTKELRHLMIDAGFDTIEALSDAADISRKTLSDILNGSIYPSSIVMHKLVNVFDMDPEHAGRVFFVKKLADNASIGA